MFGYDPDEEPAPKPDPLKPAKKEKEGGSSSVADGHAKTEGQKQDRSVSAHQAGTVPVSKGIKKGNKKSRMAASSSKEAHSSDGTAQGRPPGAGAVIKQERPAAAQLPPMPVASPKKLSKEEMERERKLFMSPNASRVHLTVSEDEARRLKEGPLMGRSRAREEENFGSFAKSVAELGTSAFWGEIPPPLLSLSVCTPPLISLTLPHSLTPLHSLHSTHLLETPLPSLPYSYAPTFKRRFFTIPPSPHLLPANLPSYASPTFLLYHPSCQPIASSQHPLLPFFSTVRTFSRHCVLNIRSLNPFQGRKKKKLEAEKLRSMGAKEPKKQSVPYNILMGQLSKEK